MDLTYIATIATIVSLPLLLLTYIVMRNSNKTNIAHTITPRGESYALVELSICNPTNKQFSITSIKAHADGQKIYVAHASEIDPISGTGHPKRKHETISPNIMAAGLRTTNFQFFVISESSMDARNLIIEICTSANFFSMTKSKYVIKTKYSP